MPKVTFVTEEKVVEAAQGEKLLEVCQRSEAIIPFGCTEGNCGTCIIKIKLGKENLNEKTEEESNTLSVYGADDGEHRLACQCIVKGDIEVEEP